MRIFLTYIFCGVGLLATCFGGPANRGSLTIKNNTAFTLVFPNDINVYSDQDHHCQWTFSAEPIEPYQQKTIAYENNGWGATNCFYGDEKKVNYNFHVSLRRPESKDKELFNAEVNYTKGKAAQWADPFREQDEHAKYNKTLRIMWQNAMLENKPGIIVYQTAIRLRGGTEKNDLVEELSREGKLDMTKPNGEG